MHTETIHCIRCTTVYNAQFSDHNRLVSWCPICKSTIYSRRPKAEADALVVNNLRLAIHTARRFLMRFGPGIIEKFGGREEFVSEANVALCNASRLYDASKGIKFSTYATVSIKQRLGQWMEHQSLKCVAGIPIRNGYHTVGYVPFRSLNAILDGNCDDRLRELGVTTEQGQECDEMEKLTLAIGELAERDQVLLTMRYLESRSYSEIGDRIGVSRTRVGQLLIGAVARLASKLGNQKLLVAMKKKYGQAAERQKRKIKERDTSGSKIETAV